MTVDQRKAEIRAWVNAQPPVDWQPMLDAFLALPEVEQGRTFLLFFGVGHEPDTTELIEALWSRGKTVALPVCLSQKQMQARQILPGARLVYNAYGIPEPDKNCPVLARGDIDLILVPNLCCDKQGHRLGHGGGYYDRYLSGYCGMTVSLCPEEWLQEQLPRDAYDLPVGLVLTETGKWRGAAAPRHGATAAAAD